MDESWQLIENDAGAKFLESVFRTFRKYYASAIAISQNIDDFAKSRIAGALIPNASIKWILNQKSSDPDSLKDALQISDKEVKRIAGLKQKRGFYSEAFLIAGDDKATVAIEPTPLEYWIATTDPRELAETERLLKENPELSKTEALRVLAKNWPNGFIKNGDK